MASPALELETKVAIYAAVQTFDCFTTDNDPHGEHDFGLIEIAGERIMFKIDYYDCSMTDLRPIRATRKSLGAC